jgi:NAD(P)-dependent dehydrogenase (short-subunit alcohol dehydrogenase family)
MDLELAGKRALITGGSKGIGFAAARRMAIEGASVALVARREPDLEAARVSILADAPGATVLTVTADVATAEGTAHAVETVARALGGLDILVNNAGTASGQPVLGITDDAWQHDLDLKFFGAVRMTRLAAPLMKAAGGGAVVNVLSIGAKTPGASSAPSSISRAAGLALTKVMSKDLAADNIRIN